MLHKHTFRAMGSQILAALDSESAQTRRRLETVPLWFEAWEESLSRFRPESELNRLNRQAGQPVRVGETLWEVFQAAVAAERATGGVVTPLVLTAMLHAGYDRSFDELAGKPADHVSAGAAQPIPPLDTVARDARTHTISLPEGSGLDFGGVAKGWAVHQAMLKLKCYGPTLVDGGGDIAISGLQQDGQPWPVGIADPLHPEQQLGVLLLGRCGVATSGRDRRRWLQNGKWQHHLIDPRSGLPAVTDVLSATVIAPTVMEAEAAAKTALISGSQAGLEQLEAHPALAGLLVLENGQQYRTTNFSAYEEESLDYAAFELVR